MATSAQIIVILLYVVTVHKLNTVEMHQVTYPKTFKATTGTTCETAAFLHDFKQHHISIDFFLYIHRENESRDIIYPRFIQN